MRHITLDNGFSPGDQVVFTRALYDLCKQHPDYNIKIDTCCPAIYQNNPYLNKVKRKERVLKVLANNLEDIGFSLEMIIRSKEIIFKQLNDKRKLKAELKKGIWYYTHVDSKKVLFTSVADTETIIPETFKKIEYNDVNNAGNSGRHFSNAFYFELEEKLKCKIKQTSLLPKLFLSETEKGWINQVEQTFNYRGKFWLINTGFKPDYPLKSWGQENWQEVINLLKDKIQFVQVGQITDNHTHEKLDNVFDLLGETDLRQLIRLSYHAEGGCSHVSLLHHLMAAWQKPSVTVAGGREPVRWEQYPCGKYINTVGQMSCADYDGCWMSGKIEDEGDKKTNKTCKNMAGNIPKCMSMIKPEYVAEQILNFYYGGKLSF